ncbi:MAG: sulfite exporter TauE/SafE family protein [SAR324 cluster bacterium]|nr:sulfite exporter TauE/SafE family protein [SAR324 cluster bacterium]
MRPLIIICQLAVIFLFCMMPTTTFAMDVVSEGTVWWIWPILLFVLTFLIGVFGVMAGIGGGVLFVPLVSSFFPFHIDFVRGAGLLIALGSSLAAAPNLLQKNLASLKLAIPCALVASTFSIIGAFGGLWLSSINSAYIHTSLGVLVLLVVALMLASKRTDYPQVQPGNFLTEALQLNGIYFEPTQNREISWTVHRTGKGLVAFSVVGVLAGMFGLGAGWANVPVLNLLMGAPLKVAVATSSFSLSITDTTAAWIYFNKGGVLPIIIIPSMAGIMLGAKIGSRLLSKVEPALIRKMVIGVLLLAGLRSLLKGFGI